MIEIFVNKQSKINTIQKAIDSITDSSSKVVIHLENGIYNEKIKLTRPNVSIVGEDKYKTIITNNDYATKIHEDGLPYNTFRTYTLMVNSSNCTLENLTIKNTSNIDFPDIKVSQAVSLALNGDLITINNCILKSHQDTLFIGPLPKNLIFRYNGFLPKDERIVFPNHRVIITNSYIEGTVDFIFGSGNAYFNNCTFHSLSEEGFVFAPSTYEEDYFGFVVTNSIFTSSFKTPKTYIARPWRDYGKVVLINSTMANHICDDGWDKWQGTNRDKTCRFYEYNTKYFDNHEFSRTYFGKNLSSDEASKYEFDNFIKGNTQS